MSRTVLIQSLLLLHHWIVAEQVGSITGMLLTSPFATIVSINGWCHDCICSMLSVENIIGLSCIENTACWFFHNYSLPYTIINSSNTSFYFLILPPEKQTFLFETTEDFPSGELPRISNVWIISKVSVLVTTMATNVGECCWKVIIRDEHRKGLYDCTSHSFLK